MSRVYARDVEGYPGVDVLWYGNQRELEFDVVVAPGADPSAVRLDVSGARSVEIDPRGDLVLATEAGQTAVRKPSLYQDAGGERQEIDGGYVLLSDHQIGFRIGSYDTSRPLVIDPVMDYSTYLGGSGFDQGNHMTAAIARMNLVLHGVEDSRGDTPLSQTLNRAAHHHAACERS